MVVDAYRAAIGAELAAESSSGPAPDLTQTHVDPLLGRVVERWIGRRALGQIVSLRPDSMLATTVAEVTIDGDEAEVLECTIDDAIVSESESGRVINDKAVSIRRRSTLQRIDGTWKHSERIVEQEWEGAVGCDLDTP